MNNFCTFFDYNYLSKGLALYNSMLEHCQSFSLYVLCMDAICYNALLRMDLPNVFLISLQNFEKDDEALRIAKINRTTVEYYFTCSPSLPLYIFNNFKDINVLTYLDSDYFFFSSPEPIMKIIGEHSIAITAHRFPPALRKLEKQYGVFNVGWLTFKRDEQAISCLQHWRAQCLEWCFDRLEEGRFADQMYLNEWPSRYPNTLVISHKGVNLAPCNIGNYQVSIKDDRLIIDEDQLVCYHFFGLKNYRYFLYYLSLHQYGTRPTRTILEHIYEPYLRALTEGKRKATEVLGEVIKTTNIRELTQIKPMRDYDSWMKKIIKMFEQYKAFANAIVSRRFILFVKGKIIFKIISCGFSGYRNKS